MWSSAGGSITFEHRNLQKKGRSATVSLTTANFLNPSNDVGYRVDYRHPYIWDDADPKRTALCMTAFNTRRLSSVFTGRALPCHAVHLASVLLLYLLVLHRYQLCTSSTRICAGCGLSHAAL